MLTHRSAVGSGLVLSILFVLISVSSRAARAQLDRQDDPALTPSPTPVATATSSSQGPEIQSFSTQQTGPTDRGIDPNTLIVNLFDASDHRDPVRTLRWKEPLQFFFDCFGESFPYVGCKLVEDLTEGGNWSVKWEGDLLVPADGEYIFMLPGHDDGVRVIIDGTEIVDSGWRYPDPDANPPPQTVNLTAGFHDIAVDYEQRVPFIAEMEVRWDGPGFSEEVLPVAAIGKARIESIELTQAIQELQTLEELKADLEPDGEPPVPLVSLKPAVARIYFEEVDTVTSVRVRFRIPGTVSKMVDRSLTPGCDINEQRLRRNGCSSIDFYFGPPVGDWTAIVETFDSEDLSLEHHDLAVTSRNAEPIQQVPVTVCRIPEGGGGPVCQDGAALSDHLPILRSSAPSRRVETIGVVREVTVPEREIPRVSDGEAWWVDLVHIKLRLLWVMDFFPTDRFYHGMADADAPPVWNGLADTLDRRTAASRVGSEYDPDIPEPSYGTMETVAHETGHLLGRFHTDTDKPSGCVLQVVPDDEWPNRDNSIQEVGFDVQGIVPDRPKIMDPESTFDWMSSCIGDTWVSPYTYNGVLDHISSADASTLAEPTEASTFWQLSGFVAEDELVLQPIYSVETEAPATAGTGEYRIDVFDQGGALLLSRDFDPIVPIPQSNDDPIVRGFLELVPVFETASSIEFIGPDGRLLETVSIEGASPLVNLESPGGGDPLSGETTISWHGSDPDSEELFYQLEYSHDGGETISLLVGNLTAQEYQVDFGRLPGCVEDCLIRVRVSDGVNSSTREIHDFSVTKKSPEVRISSPPDGSVFRIGELVSLQAFSLDRDDGFLIGDTVQWVSSRNGQLGTGSNLFTVDLSEGRHRITVRASDLNGNEALNAVEILVDGTEPDLELFVVRDQIPSSCVDVTIDADDDTNGSGLKKVEYSLNGGESWTSINPADLPFNFTVPGEGEVHIVARAVDAAGNETLDDVLFRIEEACPTTNQPPTADAGGPYSSEEGAALFLNASGSSDPENELVLYEWDLDNDGVFDEANGENIEIRFGDDGVYVVGLRVTDSFGESDTDTAEAQIDNLPPHVEIGESDLIEAAGGKSFLGQVNIDQVHAATASDPGSDDLNFKWSFGRETTYFNNGADPDPDLSPAGTFPFIVTDEAQAIFDMPGVFEVAVNVSDDDNGSAFDSLPKVITGAEACTRGLGFWKQQFSRQGHPHIDEVTPLAYLQIAEHVSSYFSEEVRITTLDDAEEIFDVGGADMRGKAEAHLAAAWLNFANGAVSWNQEIETDNDNVETAPFHEVMSTAEKILLDSDASHGELVEAKNLAESVSEFNECDNQDDGKDEGRNDERNWEDDEEE